MNLRAYYQKIKEIEAKLVEPFLVLLSLETADGGKAGVLTEVVRALAAKMIADGRARLADEAAAQAFRERNAAAQRRAEQEAAAAKVHVVLTPAEVKTAKNPRVSKEP